MRDHQQQTSVYLQCILSFFLLISAATSDETPPYLPTDCILLNCGSSLINTSLDGRNWIGDTTSKFSPSNIQHVSSSSTAAEINPFVVKVPFMTARIIRSKFTYSFPVSPGPKFVRLYFYPATYSAFNKTTSFFSATANGYTLLSNFSAFLTVQASTPRVFTIIKEFILNVFENQRLNITLSPDSPNSYAFINGIEVVSMPDPLYYRSSDNLIRYLHPDGHISSFKFDNNIALENIHRLNVGGRSISVLHESGMYRRWHQDDDYVDNVTVGVTPYLGLTINYTAKTPPYVAPETVYMTARTMGTQNNLNLNLTWRFSVDSGFNYLMRLHFCETTLEVTRANQRVFFISINSQTAETDADVIRWSGGKGIPMYKDYVVKIPDRDGRRSKQDLLLAMYPNADLEPMYYNAILNGVEIFKLNQSDGSLAGSNPHPMVDPSSPNSSFFPTKLEGKRYFPVTAIVGGIVGSVVVACLLVLVLIYWRRQRVKYASASEAKTWWVPFLNLSKSTKTRNSINSSLLPSDLCRRFLISEIRAATSNFHDNFVIGYGGFGNVYKGFVDNGSTCIAIKRSNPSSIQGVHEFETEIKMLSKLHHLHLVSLIGYSNDDGEMILVYDYMSNGTLRDHLYKTKNPPLSWKKRLEICIGAARGLCYLHNGAKHMIIHRDVKSTNILLNEKWVAKVSDFGLSKIGPIDVSDTHVSTMVKGSFGYLDPEYFRMQQLTEKSDVYSFGVVLLEVLCARPAVIQGIPWEQVSLAEWGRNCYQKGVLDQIVDTNLRGQIAPRCLKKFGEITNNCIRDRGIERPTMSDVVQTLEFALQLQETAESVKGEVGIGLDHVEMTSTSTPKVEWTATDDDDVLSASGEHEWIIKRNKFSGGKSGTSIGLVGNEDVFSEINNQIGR